jgi:psp operon transcriptional activator
MAEHRDQTPIVGQSASFLATLEHVSQAAPLSRPVLVSGERGTGKELIASRLHYLSDRWDRPLVKVNCAALTEPLLDTELFGHEAGAFTGATRTHVGHFESAADGTLVLDELGTVSPRMQEKILRVIEYGEFRRVGGARTLVTNARVIGVTNEDLPALAQRGEFRADLLDRLAFDVIHVPPLRARVDDILPLAFHFGVTVSSELKRPLFPGFDAAAEAALLRHPWPGNVRELRNAVERSVYRAAEPDAPLAEILFDPFANPYRDEDRTTRDTTIPPHEATDEETLPDGFKAAVAAFELRLLRRALERAPLNQRVTADLLGLTYHQLRGLVRKYADSLSLR